MITKEQFKRHGEEVLEAIQRGLDKETHNESDRGQVHFLIDDLRQTFFSLFEIQDAGPPLHEVMYD